MDLRWFVGHLGFSRQSGNRCTDVVSYCVESQVGSMIVRNFQLRDIYPATNKSTVTVTK